MTQLDLNGEMFVRPLGSGSGTATIVLIIKNANYTFTPVPDVCKLQEDNGSTKTFLLTLPESCEKPLSVLKYKGSLSSNRAPVNAHSQSMREANVTKLSVNIHANEQLPSMLEELMCSVAPPLLSKDEEVKRTVGDSEGSES